MICKYFGTAFKWSNFFCTCNVHGTKKVSQVTGRPPGWACVFLILHLQNEWYRVRVRRGVLGDDHPIPLFHWGHWGPEGRPDRGQQSAWGAATQAASPVEPHALPNTGGTSPRSRDRCWDTAVCGSLWRVAERLPSVKTGLRQSAHDRGLWPCKRALISERQLSTWLYLN